MKWKNVKLVVHVGCPQSKRKRKLILKIYNRENFIRTQIRSRSKLILIRTSLGQVPKMETQSIHLNTREAKGRVGFRAVLIRNRGILTGLLRHRVLSDWHAEWLHADAMDRVKQIRRLDNSAAAEIMSRVEQGPITRHAGKNILPLPISKGSIAILINSADLSIWISPIGRSYFLPYPSVSMTWAYSSSFY